MRITGVSSSNRLVFFSSRNSTLSRRLTSHATTPLASLAFTRRLYLLKRVVDSATLLRPPKQNAKRLTKRGCKVFHDVPINVREKHGVFCLT